ncbi:unnamed protein product [Rangifer tarandus platyrhynchus]|uniref:Uncharacterized protein n=2 Tax=Rangifer tarandus platyrhynchus TaxID=3082113 RepID=A0ABN8YEC6_RANTA|nr:unnamed protein product [Rangifer tarandus platyrhynchus]
MSSNWILSSLMPCTVFFLPYHTGSDVLFQHLQEPCVLTYVDTAALLPRQHFLPQPPEGASHKGSSEGRPPPTAAGGRVPEGRKLDLESSRSWAFRLTEGRPLLQGFSQRGCGHPVEPSSALSFGRSQASRETVPKP